jgi:hypothetical protein
MLWGTLAIDYKPAQERDLSGYHIGQRTLVPTASIGRSELNEATT